MKKVDLDLTQNTYENEKVANKYFNEVDSIGLWQSEKNIFEKYLKKTYKILDLGCGSGRTTFNLFKIGYENIIGLDLSQKMIENAKEYAKVNNIEIDLINANACFLPFSDESFNACIFSFNGLMTIPSRKKRREALCEIGRVLKKDGTFIFTTHDMGNEDFVENWATEKQRWKNGEQDERLTEYGDVLFFDKSADDLLSFVHVPELKEVIEETKIAGLKIIFNEKRSKICIENESIKKHSLDCIFWVCKKINLKRWEKYV